VATKVGDPAGTALSKVHLAMTAAKEARAAAGDDLSKLLSEADRWGFKPEAAASIVRGESLIAAKTDAILKRADLAPIAAGK